MMNGKRFVQRSAKMEEKQHGGKREGAGRKPSGKKLIRLYVTEDEEKKLREYLEKLRNE